MTVRAVAIRAVMPKPAQRRTKRKDRCGWHSGRSGGRRSLHSDSDVRCSRVRRELLVSEDSSTGAVTGPHTSSVGLVLAKASGRIKSGLGSLTLRVNH